MLVIQIVNLILTVKSKSDDVSVTLAISTIVLAFYTMRDENREIVNILFQRKKTTTIINHTLLTSWSDSELPNS